MRTGPQVYFGLAGLFLVSDDEGKAAGLPSGNYDIPLVIQDRLFDGGWKDTVLLMPGMKVKILLRFEDYTGLFLYHCHNLEHEDMGMMRNYLIRY